MSRNNSQVRYGLLTLSLLGLLALGLVIPLFGEIPWVQRIYLYAISGAGVISVLYGLAGQTGVAA